MEQARLLRTMEKKQYPANTIIFNKGDPGDGLYAIQEGTVEIFMEQDFGPKNILAVLTEGQCFGEMALLSNEPRTASAVAQSDVLLLKIGPELFERMLAEQTSVSAGISRLLCRRLAQNNRALQAAKSNQLQMITAMLEKLPGELQQVLGAASMLPFPSLIFLSNYFRIPDLAGAVKEHAATFSYLAELDNINGTIHTDSALRHILQQFYREAADEGARNQLLMAAAAYYLENKMPLKAMELYKENSFWQEACNLIRDQEQLYKDYKTASKEEFFYLLGYLENCSIEILLKNYDIFMLFMKSYLEKDPATGLTIVEAGLKATQSLEQPQIAELYAYAAKFCNELELEQKALEYLNIAFNYSSTQGDSFFQLGQSSMRDAVLSGDQQRAFQLARRNIESAQQVSLAQNARRWFGKSNILTAIVLLVCVSFLLYFGRAEPFIGLDQKGMLFLGISLAAMLLWIFELFPPYLVALLMAMSWVLGGLVTAEKALSGFSFPIWIFAVAILGLSAALSKSGLLYRLSLIILRLFPPTYRGQLAGLAAGGLLLSPLIPSAIARVALASPVALGIAESMGFSDRSKGSAGLGLTAMVFFGMITPFFLTAGAINFVALGLIPDVKISWLEWFWWSLPLMLFFSVFMFISILVLFRQQDTRHLSSQLLKDQLATLGSLTRQEYITMIVVGTVMLSLILQPLHNLDSVWVVLIGFSLLVVGGLLDKNTLKTGIDWPFLLYIGITFSFAEVTTHLGVTAWLAGNLTSSLSPFIVSPYILLPAIAVLVFLVSFVIQDNPVVIILTLSLLPLVREAGIHPWLLIFIIILAGSPFFFSYQSTIYLTAYYGTDEKAFSHRQGRALSYCYALIAIAGIVICIPFWKLAGLIA